MFQKLFLLSLITTTLAMGAQRRCVFGDNLNDLESSMEFTSKKGKTIQEFFVDRKVYFHVETFTHRATGEVYTVKSTFRDDDDGGNTIGYVEDSKKKKVASIGDSEFGECKVKASPASVMCKEVDDKWSARFCVDAWVAENIEKREDTVAYLTTDKNTAFRAMGSILNEGKAKSDVWERFHAADYLVATYQPDDESIIRYYAVNNGKSVKPALLVEINSVAIPYNYKKNGVKPLNWALGQKGIPRWPYEDFDRNAKDIKDSNK